MPEGSPGHIHLHPWKDAPCKHLRIQKRQRQAPQGFKVHLAGNPTAQSDLAFTLKRLAPLKPMWTAFSGYRWTDWLWTLQQLIRLWWWSRSGISATRWLSPFQGEKNETRFKKFQNEFSKGQETSSTWVCRVNGDFSRRWSVVLCWLIFVYEFLIDTKLVLPNQEETFSSNIIRSIVKSSVGI